MSKLQDFISTVKQTGLMRTARYTVIIPFGENSDLVSMYCDQVQLPGMNYNTTAIATYGEAREVPYGRMFDSLTLSFYVDNEMKVKRYFDNWMAQVQNPLNRTFNYYNDYVKKVQVIVEDVESMGKYAVNLYECYPKTIGSIQLDYASKDVMKLNITLAYKYWQTPESEEIYTDQVQSTNLLTYALPVRQEFQGVYTGLTDGVNYGTGVSS